MVLSTFLVGVLPGSETIGWLAPSTRLSTGAAHTSCVQTTATLSLLRR